MAYSMQRCAFIYSYCMTHYHFFINILQQLEKNPPLMSLLEHGSVCDG